MQVSQLEGVYSVQEPHFWTLCSDVYIGTIKLEVAANADGRYLVSQTHNIFTQVRSTVEPSDDVISLLELRSVRRHLNCFSPISSGPGILILASTS